MTVGLEVSVQNLTKQFGSVRAVDDLTFTVRPGAVTGFLGPNGAGKTTTLRMLLGLIHPSSGKTTIGGRPYRKLGRPMQVVGAALEATDFHPGRRGIDHLRVFAGQAGATEDRCHELLELVGLSQAAKRRVKGYSLGMRQRLALATALLGDPDVLILDEPANGLDPQGIVWLRNFLRSLAASGKTVLVSSHVLGEVQNTVDDVLIIAQGRLVHASTLAELRSMAVPRVGVITPAADGLESVATQRGWHVSRVADNRWVIDGPKAAEVGAAAFAAGVELHHLSDIDEGLESLFLRLTQPANAEGTNS